MIFNVTNDAYFLFIGRCIAGDACKFPHLWLRPQDKCPDCKEIVHPLCGVETGDSHYTCPSCYNKNCSETNNVSQGDTTIEAGCNTTTSEISCVNTEIKIAHQESTSVVSTITETKDKDNFTTISKDYFVMENQLVNMEAKKRDGDIWLELRKAAIKAIDQDLKSMMILRSQEVGLKVVTPEGEKIVSCWSDIGKAWRNSDSIDTAKKLYEVVHATFDDNSSYEIYMEAKIMERLELKYREDDKYDKKGCIARMIMTRKSELNKLINKRSETTHQKKISSKRSHADKTNRYSRGTFTIKDANNNASIYHRDGSICGSEKKEEVARFNSHFYMDKIRKLEKEKQNVRIFMR